MFLYMLRIKHVWLFVQVGQTSDEKLNQPLLQFHEDSTAELQLLAVDFDPALVRLLRETRYFLLLKVEVGRTWQQYLLWSLP